MRRKWKKRRKGRKGRRKPVLQGGWKGRCSNKEGWTLKLNFKLPPTFPSFPYCRCWQCLCAQWYTQTWWIPYNASYRASFRRLTLRTLLSLVQPRPPPSLFRAYHFRVEATYATFLGLTIDTQWSSPRLGAPHHDGVYKAWSIAPCIKQRGSHTGNSPHFCLVGSWFEFHLRRWVSSCIRGFYTAAM